MNPIPVNHNPQENRFEVRAGEALGVLDYEQKGRQILLIHTRVPDEMEGQGIGTALVRAALDYAREAGLRPVAICSFTRSYIIRHPERQDVPGFYEILPHFEPAIQLLTVRARSFIYDVMPGVVEVPWVHQRNIGYGVGPKKMSEHFAYIAPQKEYVNLGFFYGAELPDPNHLLEGTGKLLRHVKIRSKEQLADPALRELMVIATTHRMPARDG